MFGHCSGPDGPEKSTPGQGRTSGCLAAGALLSKSRGSRLVQHALERPPTATAVPPPSHRPPASRVRDAPVLLKGRCSPTATRGFRVPGVVMLSVRCALGVVQTAGLAICEMRSVAAGTRWSVLSGPVPLCSPSLPPSVPLSLPPVSCRAPRQPGGTRMHARSVDHCIRGCRPLHLHPNRTHCAPFFTHPNPGGQSAHHQRWLP